MTLKFPKLFLFLLGALLILNILQSTFTELIYDEAYYWYYSQNMAWGYFDHPPMVASLAKMSSLFFDGELGVRFFSCLLGIGTYILIWLMIDNTKKKDYVPHFFLLLFSMALVNAYGFFTLPDTPLLFFTTLFLFVYKKFIQNPSVPITIGLGLTMAALMYSKYHAVLVIVFVLFSNWRLIFNKYAWLALFVSLICFVPHLSWLFQNDFITIKYHLLERPNHAYSFTEFTLGYFLNLILIFGLLFPWMYLSLFKSKINGDKFIKALHYLTYGFIIFFFVSSFNRRVQTQWVVIICIPMAILAFEYLIIHANSRKWIFRMGVISTILLLYARVWLVDASLLPIRYEAHGNKDWVHKLQSKVNEIPVVFKNSYRRASMYGFYSANPSYSLNTTGKRHNQYSIDDSEAKLQGKRVAYISKSIDKSDFSYTRLDNSTFYGKYIDRFESYRKLGCFVDGSFVDLSKPEGTLLKIFNPYAVDIPLTKISMSVAYLNAYKKLQFVHDIQYEALTENSVLKSNDTTYFRSKVPLPEENNIHYIQFGISASDLPAGINSKKLKIKGEY